MTLLMIVVPVYAKEAFYNQRTLILKFEAAARESTVFTLKFVYYSRFSMPNAQSEKWVGIYTKFKEQLV